MVMSSMFRANHRHPVDDRVLIIQDMEDFRLWRERAQLGIHGIMWRCDINDEVLAQEAEKIATEIEDLNQILRNSNSTSFPVIKGTLRRTQEQRRLWGFLAGKPIQDIFTFSTRHGRGNSFFESSECQVSDRLRTMVNYVANPRSDLLSYALRRNSDGFRTLESHRTTLTFAFQHAGTVACTGNYSNEGERYQAAPGEFFIFDEDIFHESPKPDQSWRDKPRILAAVDLGPFG